MPHKKANGKIPARGFRITKGSKWTLTDRGGTHRQFAATVIDTFVIGGKRIALVSVPARIREKRQRRRKQHQS
jgi:hypothetical protein